LGILSSIKSTRNARIAVGVGAGAVAGLAAVGSFVGGLSSGALGNIAAAPPYDRDSVKFPTELFENDHYIEFTAKRTQGGAEEALGKFADVFKGIQGNTVLGGSIYLPMPSQLSTDYNPDYGTPDLGPAAGMALKPADQAIYGNDSMGMKAASGLSLAGLGGAITGGIGQAAVNAVNSIPGSGAATGGAILKVAGGVALNQHKIVLFTGVNFREHQFSWKLSPKNRKESNDIKKIIDLFAYYSHPEYIAGGLFFKYPEYFEIKFRHPEYLFKLQPSVCKDIKVNYHGQGYAAYIRDANGGGVPAPAEIELSLTFLETEIVTKQSLMGTLTTPPVQRIPSVPAQMPMVDPMGNAIGNGLDVFGNQIT
jgi:hypothetical protein